METSQAILCPLPPIPGYLRAQKRDVSRCSCRISSLVKHLVCRKHKLVLEHEMLCDRAIIEYMTKLDCGLSKVGTVIEGSKSSKTNTPTLAMGWALKSTQLRRSKFSDKQRQYLDAKFQIGERTGRKADPTDVSKAMRTAKDSNGERLLGCEHFHDKPTN